MPADYTSTARALSISTSPGPFSPTDDDDAHPPWRHHRNQSANRHGYTRGSTSGNVTTSVRDQAVHRAAKIYRRLHSAWQRMSWWQRIGALAALFGVTALGLAFMIFTGQVFAWLGPVAGEWENSKMVFFILWLCVFFVSFPPLVGWSTFGTISGFIFGVWKGWLLYATGTVLGSVCSFIVSRTVLSKFVNRLMERDKRFAALALTLKYDGLKLLCMIRLCPLPYSICNGGVSTFPTVHPLMYGLATIIISPKLLVPTFIGSRLRLLSEKNEEMSLGSKAVNVGSIVLTVAIGVFTGWYIYKRTLARAKELEAKERDDIRNSLQEDHAANRPHRRFSGDPNANTAATTLARDEEEQAGFHDLDDDNVDIVIGDDSDSDPSSSPKKTSPYHDEFTDNDSDVFGDGDGSVGETYQLHSQRSNSRPTSKPG